MKTRQQYMNKEVSHDAYYRQFVTPGILALVESHIGLAALKASTDQHLNDIPLAKWDAMHPLPGVYDALKQAGDGYSLSATVCITKAAARMILEGVAA